MLLNVKLEYNVQPTADIFKINLWKIIKKYYYKSNKILFGIFFECFDNILIGGVSLRKFPQDRPNTFIHINLAFKNIYVPSCNLLFIMDGTSSQSIYPSRNGLQFVQKITLLNYMPCNCRHQKSKRY